jgi:antitoxin FitA
VASITIRNIDDRVKQALRVQAAEKGLSMEEGLRQLLETVATNQSSKPLNLAEEFTQRFDPLGGVSLTPFSVGHEHRRFFWEDDEETDGN